MPSPTPTVVFCETRSGDMAQTQIHDPLRLLEPGGGLGWGAAVSIAFLIAAVVLTTIAMIFAPNATLSFLSLGGFNAQ